MASRIDGDYWSLFSQKEWRLKRAAMNVSISYIFWLTNWVLTVLFSLSVATISRTLVFFVVPWHMALSLKRTTEHWAFWVGMWLKHRPPSGYWEKTLIFLQKIWTFAWQRSPKWILHALAMGCGWGCRRWSGYPPRLILLLLEWFAVLSERCLVLSLLISGSQMMLETFSGMFMVVMLELEMLWHGKLAFLLVWYLKLYAKLLSVFMIVVMVEEPLVCCLYLS